MFISFADKVVFNSVWPIISPKFEISGILGYYGFGLDAAAIASAAAARQGLCFTQLRHQCAYQIHIRHSSIDDLEWKNPIDFGENRKTKMDANGHFVKIR